MHSVTSLNSYDVESALQKLQPYLEPQKAQLYQTPPFILFIFMHNRRWIKLTFITWVPPSFLLLSSWTFSSSCNKKSMFSFCLASKRSFSCCKNIETSVGTTTYLSTQDFGSSTLSSLICKALPSRVFGSLWMEDSMHPSQAI